jgi:perosamine synthetase
MNTKEMQKTMNTLALLGGAPAVSPHDEQLFRWPIITPAIEEAVLSCLRAGNMSGIDITRRFEAAYAQWNGRAHALAHSSGTAALHSAMYALGLGPGDEMICPSITYWASAVQALSLGARVIFADVEPDTLCLDPQSFAERITERTKAVIVVHYLSHPANMDAIMDIARKRGIKVIEDVSHAQGGLYKGKMLGSFGDVAAFSLMSGKSFAIGEAGMLLCDDEEILKRAVRFAHYERQHSVLGEDLDPAIGPIPWGGYKYRIHQLSSVVGVEQLKKYPAEMAEIDRAMRYFTEAICKLPGIRAHYPKDAGSTKAGWYASVLFYEREQLGGLSLARFIAAVQAEGVRHVHAGCNRPLHQSKLFYDVDIYGHGQPTARVHWPADGDPRTLSGELPVSAGVNARVFSIPWFKHFQPEVIDQYIEAFRKVTAQYQELLAADAKKESGGIWFQPVKN